MKPIKHPITLDLPDEFIDLCKADNIAPEVILKGFIADLTGMMNWSKAPREDGYASHGSDERNMARQYYERVGYPYWNQ